MGEDLLSSVTPSLKRGGKNLVVITVGIYFAKNLLGR